MYKPKFSHLLSGCALLSLTADPVSQNYVSDVLYNQELFEQFSPFCMNVLRMQTEAEWESLVQDVQKDCPEPTNDAQLYAHLKGAYARVKPKLYPYRLYVSLKQQQKILGDQAGKILGRSTPINGYVEIGAPCRYVDYIEQHVPVTGIRYAVHDQPAAWSDILESRIPHPTRGLVPYNRMISLNDYAPIACQDIPDASVDLVVCFIGLHHIPLHKIDAFVASIKRILRPGGVFLLRDHDAHNEQIYNIAWTAHTVFNAIIADSSDEEEAQELRNFQPIAYWVDVLTKHGFEAGAERVLQEGDSTLNTLVKFTKPVSAQDAFLQELHSQPGHVRMAHQTFLTGPEWYNVDCAQAYGAFLNHTPWYAFPYWESIKTYWHMFRQSYKQARATDSVYNIWLKGDYLSMSLFVGTFMTVEYALKAMISWPVAKMVYAADTTINIVMQHDDELDAHMLPTAAVVKDRRAGLTVIQVPRYGDFQNTIRALSTINSTIVEIGGQKKIQVKVRVADIQGAATIAPVQTWADIHGAELSYTWRVPSVPYTYGSLVVPVEKLTRLVRDAGTHPFEIAYIHDF